MTQAEMLRPLEYKWTTEAVKCAQCGRSVHERDLAYTRDHEETWTCSQSCDKARCSR